MAESLIPSFSGLNVNDNQNISSPGSLIEAFDVVCDKPGVIESAHSFQTFNPALAQPIDQNMQLDSVMVLHSDNKIFVDDGGVWLQKSGAYSTPNGATAIRSTEANNSLYFTDNTGVKVLDSVIAGSIREAGIPRSGDIEVNVSGQYAFTNGDIVQGSTAAAGTDGSVTCIDSLGNVIIAFRGPSNFYVIQKYDPNGNLLWRSTQGSEVGASPATVNSISVDSNNNIYMSGGYNPGGTSSVNNVYVTGAVSAFPIPAPFIVKYNSSGALQWTCVFANVTANVDIRYFTNIYVDNRSGFDQVYIGINANNTSLAVATFGLSYSFTNAGGTSIGTYNRNCPILVGISAAGSLFFSSTAYVLAGGGTIAGIPISTLSGFVYGNLLTLGVSASTTGIVAHTFNGQTIPTNSLVVYRLLIDAAAPATVRVLTYAQNRNTQISHIDTYDGTTDTVFFCSRTVNTTQIISFTSVPRATATPAALTNISAEVTVTATSPSGVTATLLYNRFTNALYFYHHTSNGVNGSGLLGVVDGYLIMFTKSGSTWSANKTQQYGGSSLYIRFSTNPTEMSRVAYLRPSDGSIVLGGFVANNTNTTGLYGNTYISSASTTIGDYFSILIDPTQLNQIDTIEYGNTTSTSSAIFIGTHTYVANDSVVFYSTGSLPSPLVSGRPYVISSVTAGSISIIDSFGGSAVQIFPTFSSDVHYVRYVSQPSASYTNGFLPNNRQVAYRAVIGRIDTKSYLKLGPPSAESFQVPNLYSRDSAVNIRVFIPDGLDTEYFVEIYRSQQTTFPTPPNDELYFSVRHQLTGTDISNGYADIVDTTPDGSLGAILYTSPSQEGIINENEQPPISTDIAFYKGLTLYSNIRYKQRFVFTFSWHNITDNVNLATTSTYNILRVTNGTTTFDIYLTSLVNTVPAGNFYYENNGNSTYCAYRSALNMVEAINNLAGNTIVNAYLIGVSSNNATILLEEKTANSAALSVSKPYSFSGAPIIVYDDPDFSDGARENRILVSKVQQPDAVPLGNFYDVGPAGCAIKRIVPMRNSVFVLTNKGTFQILGNTLQDFQTNNYNIQMNMLLLADSSPAVLDNVLYFLSNNWIVACNENSWELIGKPIQPLIESGFESATPPSKWDRAYGIADNTNNRYLLCYARGNSTSDPANVIYAYSSYTNQWTIWRKDANCGIVISDNLFLAVDSANLGSPKQMYEELDSFKIADYADSAPKVTLKMFTMDNFAIIKQFNKLYLQFQNPYPGDLTLTVKTEVEGSSSTFPVTIQTTNTASTWDYDKVVPGIVETDLAIPVGRLLYVTIEGPNSQNLTLNGAWVQWTPNSEAP